MSYMNLLPESYVKRQFRDRMNTVCVLVFAAITVSAFFVDLITRGTLNKAQTRYTSATVLNAQASGLTGDFFGLQRAMEVMVTEAKDAMEMEECIPRSYLLGVITNSLPKTVSLTKVHLQTQIPVIPKKKNNLNNTGLNNNLQRISSVDQSAGDITPEPKPKPIVTVKLEGISVSGNDYDVAKLIRTLKKKGLSKKVTLLYARQWKPKNSNMSMEGQQKLREFGICMELRNDVDVRRLIKSGGRKANPPSLPKKSAKTGTNMDNSSVEGAAK